MRDKFKLNRDYKGTVLNSLRSALSSINLAKNTAVSIPPGFKGATALKDTLDSLKLISIGSIINQVESAVSNAIQADAFAQKTASTFLSGSNISFDSLLLTKGNNKTKNDKRDIVTASEFNKSAKKFYNSSNRSYTSSTKKDNNSNNDKVGIFQKAWNWLTTPQTFKDKEKYRADIEDYAKRLQTQEKISTDTEPISAVELLASTVYFSGKVGIGAARIADNVGDATRNLYVMMITYGYDNEDQIGMKTKEEWLQMCAEQSGSRYIDCSSKQMDKDHKAFMDIYYNSIGGEYSDKDYERAKSVFGAAGEATGEYLVKYGVGDLIPGGALVLTAAKAEANATENYLNREGVGKEKERIKIEHENEDEDEDEIWYDLERDKTYSLDEIQRALNYGMALGMVSSGGAVTSQATGAIIKEMGVTNPFVDVGLQVLTGVGGYFTTAELYNSSLSLVDEKNYKINEEDLTAGAVDLAGTIIVQSMVDKGTKKTVEKIIPDTSLGSENIIQEGSSLSTSNLAGDTGSVEMKREAVEKATKEVTSKIVDKAHDTLGTKYEYDPTKEHPYKEKNN